ncbi:hypothetical protein PC119_g5958 [Phytophthora cactorum]|uniref:P-loop containing nucleoside triphosphate hydrolase n=1 Tax=Phytophthora cactorum TaxID=29920 RepID=A0A8T1C485_9STRA|nr:hypothetical protein PC117_g18252 [Phytophthora cactorum]KAG3031377.1 hypothetical protein PC119_g5958 [Phytophthora cactorum]
MGNEVSRPADLSPQSSGAVPPRSPYTPTGGSSRRAQSFSTRSPSPSPAASNAPPPQRRTSSSSSLGSNPSSTPRSNPKKERTIQRMDKAIRRRVRGGITYNMKLLVRGAKGTGKTSLFQRLKGEPIPDTHQSTPQLQSATIKWSFRQHLEENVKCEVWDVVDKGFVPVETDEGAEEDSTRTQNASAEHGGLQSGGGLSAEASAAAAAAAAAMQNGTHSVAIVDASTVDVYHEAHGVIFLLDVTKWDTLEYVKQQLDNVPVHIPTLVLGNFRDQGAQRKIFKEDIQELLYGSSDRPQPQQWRRPMELLYFECSLLNCYGLKSLHQYFGIPFLQLKLATIRQQMRIVEGEFTHLKHDVQATISEQRYADYVEHIKATGSDIRTGRRGSGNENTPPAASRSNLVRLSPKESDQTKSTMQRDGADNDVSVVGKENSAGTPPKASTEVAAVVTEASEAPQQRQEVAQSQDMEDLPARTNSVVIQAAPRLKFEHKESVASLPDDIPEDEVSKDEDGPALSQEQSSKTPVTSNASSTRPRKASVEEVMHLEDFQVPKVRVSDLDHFYSESESDEDVGDDDEVVVVAPVDRSMGGVSHKQRFIDSDSSDSDEVESAGSRLIQQERAPRKSSPRRSAIKQASTAGQTAPRPLQSSTSPPSPHLPPSVSRPNQRSRPGSPARVESSTSVDDPQAVPREVSPKQRQSSSPVRVVTQIPPVAPSTPPSASPMRHSSPRNKSDNPVVQTHDETRESLSQGGGEVKQETSSSEEPGLPGTEVVVESISPRVQESLSISTKHEISKSPVASTRASSEDETEDADIIDSVTTHTAINKELDASILPVKGGTPAIEDDANSEPEDVDRVPTTDRDSNLIEKESEGASADGDMDGLDDVAASSNELNTFLADDDSDGGDDDDNALAAPQENVVKAEEPVVSKALLPDVLTSDGGHDEDTPNRNESIDISLSSLQASIPMPETSAHSFASALSGSMDSTNSATRGQEEVSGHYHKRNHDEAGDLLSLSSLQASLPLPALRLSDLQTSPSKALASKAIVPDFATVVPSNDLEDFLNESDSDSENAPPTYAEPQSSRQGSRRAMVESSDDDDEEDLDRFESYSISKKNRSERRRQQKEDLRQLNAALDLDNDPFAPSMSAVAVSDSSFGSSDVMEAIRKAQEEAMRMLPTDHAPADDADSASSKKKHRHKHKKEQKHKKRDGEGSSKDKSKKSSRKSGSSSRSKKRRPHVEDDLM